MKARDLTNIRFGNLVGLRQDGKSKHGQYIWLLKCDCGNEHRCLGSSLINGYTTRCKQCTKQRWLDQNHLRATCVGDLTSAWWSAKVVKRANGHNTSSFLKGRKKIYELTITMEQAWQLFEKQERTCALSGILLEFPKDRNPHGGTASLDRIDSKKDYTADNVQWVHKDINRLKNVFDQAHFINLCKAVAKNN
jgi:hypothetical protein